MPDPDAGTLRVVDAHQHVWDLERATYPWMDEEPDLLRRTYTQAEVQPGLTRAGVGATVLVQAADNVEDTQHMIAVARTHPQVAGIVAWVPLQQPDEAIRHLEAWNMESRIVGVRHLIHREPDPRWLLRPDVSEGLEALSGLGVPFDVCAETAELLAIVPTLAQRHPELILVLDHLGKPPIRSRGWQPWAEQIAEAAELPNVVAKVSGLNTAAAPGTWTGADLVPYVAHAVSVFGADRLMYGGDWPYALLNADSYTQVWTGIRRALDDLAPADLRMVLRDTACRVYGIDPARVGHRPSHPPSTGRTTPLT